MQLDRSRRDVGGFYIQYELSLENLKFAQSAVDAFVSRAILNGAKHALESAVDVIQLRP